MTRNRWVMLAGTATTLVLGVTAFGWARGDLARSSTTIMQDDHPPSSAGLLRRLAESADAYRTGRTVYLVAQDSGLYPVFGAFENRDSAITVAHNLGARWFVYSTQTKPDYGGDVPTYAQVILPGCYKDTRTTLWICPPKDSTRTTAGAMRLQDVVRIDVTFIRRNGRRLTIPLDPEHAGATIYTIQDFDRFIVPYYTRLFGPAQVAQMRADLLTFVRRSLDSATAAPPR
jgi:hypothetical protein